VALGFAERGHETRIGQIRSLVARGVPFGPIAEILGADGRFDLVSAGDVENKRDGAIAA
jgi:hypothetical protein